MSPSQVKLLIFFLADLIQSAFLMLEWEQKGACCGGAEQGGQLVEQLKGKCIMR
jgi:hypothetical protein